MNKDFKLWNEMWFCFSLCQEFLILATILKRMKGSHSATSVTALLAPRLK